MHTLVCITGACAHKDLEEFVVASQAYVWNLMNSRETEDRVSAALRPGNWSLLQTGEDAISQLSSRMQQAGYGLTSSLGMLPTKCASHTPSYSRLVGHCATQFAMGTDTGIVLAGLNNHARSICTRYDAEGVAMCLLGPIAVLSYVQHVRYAYVSLWGRLYLGFRRCCGFRDCLGDHPHLIQLGRLQGR